MLVGGFLGRRDRDQLDLVELVLAQHAAGVAPRRPGLGPEAGRQRGEAQGQFLLAEDRLADEVGQRHLGGGDEPEFLGTSARRILLGLVALCRAGPDGLRGVQPLEDGELVVLELRQLRRAEHGRIAHQDRRRHLQIPVLLRVQVEHELAQRPLQPGELALQHHEARAGQLGRRLEIHQPGSLAELEMLPALGEPLARRGVAAVDWTLPCSSAPVRHVGLRQVRDRGEPVGQGLVGRVLRRLQGRLGGFQRRDLVHQRGGPGLVLGLLGAADLLGQRVAPLLVRLRGRDRRLPRLVEGGQRGRERREAAAGEVAVEGVRVLPDGADVVHRIGSGIGCAASARAPALPHRVRSDKRGQPSRAALTPSAA